jgi:hypothetical protein
MNHRMLMHHDLGRAFDRRRRVLQEHTQNKENDE